MCTGTDVNLTVGICLGRYGGLGEGAISDERGTLVPHTQHINLRKVGQPGHERGQRKGG